MKIHLPNSAFLGNIDSFLRSIDFSDENVLEITFNKKWMSLHPVVLTMVGALAFYFNDNEKKIICGELEAVSRNYLERMGLLKLLGMNSLDIKEHEPAGRYIPLQRIKNSDDLGIFISDMIPLLHTTPEQAEPIKYIISELIRNVFEHSKSPIGAIVSAQYFKKTNRISIGVVDVGVGIRSTISRSHRVDNDITGLRLALTPGITGWSKNPRGTASNAGAGLFFIKSIAMVNRDFFMIYSGTAMYKLLKTPEGKNVKLYVDPFEDNHSRHNNLPYWTGTVVGIDISLTQHKKFDILLDLIREVYRSDIKRRKKDKLKRARFV
jgi:anti-sigma regulatory factor (Ser/Thr protein kinase)